eukprot:6204379-Pleurochrysis_carterae.AAC.1
MGSPECFCPSAAVGAAFLQLKNELRASGSLYPAIEPIARYWLQIQYAIELHTFTLLMAGEAASARDGSSCGQCGPSPLSRQPSSSAHGPGHADDGASCQAVEQLTAGWCRRHFGDDEACPHAGYGQSSAGRGS